MKRKTRRRAFAWRRLLALAALAVLLVVTIPLAGFRTQAGSNFTAYEQGLISAGFPESYVHLLSALHDKYPNWTFEPYHTGLNWASAVSSECSGGRSLAVSSAADIFKSKAAGCYDPVTGAYVFVESGYVTASEFAVSYYMDPRNFLREEYILQFESLVYHETPNELAVIQSILRGSVLDGGSIVYKNSRGESITLNTSHAQAILDAGKKHGVNPFYLASKIRNEVGSGGATISGTVAGYEGLYNYYNIYAYGASSIQQSLAWAASGSTYNRPWTTPLRSIDGGAEYIAAGYISRGQNTSYFQRFNVVGQPYYSHQYMTAIHGAAEEAYNTYKALSADVFSAARTFVIPVYNNMPQSAVRLADAITLDNFLGSGVANANVNLRTSPTTSASNLSGHVLAQGTAVTILAEVRSSGTDFMKYPHWYKISCSAGEGYVCADYINVSYAATRLEVGATMQLRYQLSPVSAAESPVVSSSNNGVATVNSNGVVVGVAPGLAYVTATINNGSRVTAALSVVPATTDYVAVTELVLNAETLSLSSGETFQLAAQIYPREATFRDINWSTDNASVVSVGADGVVKAVGGGTATVVAASADSGAYATCRVTVNAPVIEEPPVQSGGIVDLDSRLEQLQQTNADLKAAIEAAERLDAQLTGMLEGLDAPDDDLLPSTDTDPGALAPGLEDLQPGHASVAATQTTSFTVRVQGTDGDAATDASVLLKSASDKLVSTAHHVTDGQYIFENILNGSYTVEVTAPNGSRCSAAIRLSGGVLTGDTELVLEMPQHKSALGLWLAVGAIAGVTVVGLTATVIGRLRRKKNKRRSWRPSL